MRWVDLLGHEQQKVWFQTALQNRRLASSFLFIGPEGIGKRSFARLLAKSLLCPQTDPNALEFCDNCEACVQVDASTHPDLIQVAKPADRATIPVELLIGEREKRMREGLCYDLSLRPYSGTRKIAILDDADFLNAEGANCLLKTLEEPPAGSLFILVGTSLQRQLPTIRSRCQSILFRPLSRDHVAKLLQELHPPGADPDEHGPISQDQAEEIASHAEGSLAKAWQLADEGLQHFRSKLIEMLHARQLPMGELVKQVTGLVDDCGKDNRAKRDRLKVILQMAAEHYRSGYLTESDFDHDTLMDCWNCCLQAIEQVDRNANQAALIESWSSDLAVLSRR